MVVTLDVGVGMSPLEGSFWTYWALVHVMQMSYCLYVETKLWILVQWVDLCLSENRISGTLPSSWANFTQASHASKKLYQVSRSRCGGLDE